MKRKVFSIVFLPLLLFLGLIFLVYPLFTGEYTQFVQSIESQYLGYVRFMVENFPHIWWNPYWYMGFPFYIVYQPILPFSIAFLSSISGILPSIIYRASIGFFFSIGAISVYFLAREITSKNLSAFVAAVIYGLFSPALFLIPAISAQIASFSRLPWRLIILVYYGEGAHTWGLASLPLGLLFLKKLFNQPTRAWFLLTLTTFVFTLLISSTAFIPLVLFAFILLIFEIMRRKRMAKVNSELFFLLFLFTFGLGFFWYNPPFLKAAMGFAQEGGVFRGVWASPTIAGFSFLSISGLLYLSFSEIVKKYKRHYALILTSSWFVFFFLLVFLRYEYEFSLLPIPFDYLSRFGPEVDLSFSLLVAAVVSKIEASIFKNKFFKSVTWGTVFLGFFFMVYFEKQTFWSFTKPNSNIARTTEYKVSQWLKENVRSDERVFISGSQSQWLNVWTNVDQLRGVKGGDFGGINPWWAHVTHQLLTGRDGDLAIKWLKALGIKYIVVNFPNTEAKFNGFIYPQKYGSLGKVFEYQGDVVYSLPLRNNSFALALPENWSLSLKTPGDLRSGKIVLDEKFLDGYLYSVEESAQPIKIDYPYKGSWSKMRIPASQIALGKEILIRQTFNSGWQAEKGRGVEIVPDPIGFTVIKNHGSEDVILNFSLPTNVVVSYGISLAFLIILVVFLIRGFDRKSVS